MNITFLVGNGFDLSAGLNTSYKQFYQWYCDKSNSVEDSDVIKQFKQDIIERKGEYWSDFEYGLGQYTEKFSHDEEEKYIECYEDAHEKMNKFIKRAEGQYDKTLITDSSLDDFGKSISDFYQVFMPKEKKIFNDLMDSDKSSSTTINFISFNFTNVLDLYVRGVAERDPLKEWKYSNSLRTLTVSPEVLHIHGETDYFPVLGVSEEEFVANPELLQNVQINNALIKGNSVDSLGQYWYEEAENQINKSRIICIFGMSIGKSDSLWWKKIMQWLDSNPNRHLILYCYNLQSQDTISILRRSENIENAKDMLTPYFAPNHTKNIKDRIHIADSGHTLVVPTMNMPPTSKVYDGS